MYICWAKNNTILGIASTEERAREMCSKVGDCYLKVVPDVKFSEDINVTKLCVHNTSQGFLTYDEATEVVKKIAGIE